MSLIKQYADIFGIPLNEVQEWVNNYSNKKNIPDGMIIEDTKEERIKSIKQYIQSQVDDSITMRVKGSLIGERIASAEVKVLCEVPF